jgi:CheY-like chemotaxis protein
VEDDAFSLMTLQSLIENSGNNFEIHSAQNGQEGINRVKDRQL